MPTLTTAHAAHSLQFDEAKRGYPVHLRAVVTYYDPETNPRTGAFFACDDTGCIAVLEFVRGPFFLSGRGHWLTRMG